jgi:hypothetical protein
MYIQIPEIVMAAVPLVRNFEPLETLESRLIQSLRGVTRAEHQFLVLLREFDLRRGWASYGNNDCAEWLNWKCGISRTTAQERVRVAQALWFLPQIGEAFRRGDLSYSKVRALTRVATEANETDLLSFALDASASQCEDYCRRLRNGDPVASLSDARRLHERRSLTRHLREDGSGTLTVELPQEALELVMKALERVGALLPEDPTRSLFAKGADALVQMARESLAGGGGTGAAADEHQVVVHVDASALSGQGGESQAPLPTVRRLTCDGALVPVVERDGDILNVGRKQRTVPTAIKRALLARDRTCTWPGCHHRRFLEAHHVHHWAEGGETSLSNLILTCSHHHALIHEGGFSVQRRADRSLYFVRPDGRPVEAPSAEDDWSAVASAEDAAPNGGGAGSRELRDVCGVYRIAPPSAEGEAQVHGNLSLACLSTC